MSDDDLVEVLGELVGREPRASFPGTEKGMDLGRDLWLRSLLPDSMVDSLRDERCVS